MEPTANSELDKVRSLAKNLEETGALRVQERQLEEADAGLQSEGPLRGRFVHESGNWYYRVFREDGSVYSS